VVEKRGGSLVGPGGFRGIPDPRTAQMNDDWLISLKRATDPTRTEDRQ